MLVAAILAIALAADSPSQAGPGTPVARSPCAGGCPWITSFGEKLERSWNPHCEVEGGNQSRLLLKFRLNPEGFLIGEPVVVDELTGQDLDLSDSKTAAPDLLRIEAIGARSALLRGQPYADVPPELVGRRIVVRFNAQKACH